MRIVQIVQKPTLKIVHILLCKAVTYVYKTQLKQQFICEYCTKCLYTRTKNYAMIVASKNIRTENVRQKRRNILIKKLCLRRSHKCLCYVRRDDVNDIQLN